MTNFENRKNEIWKEITSLGHDFETSMDQLERKQTGFYLTSLALTDAMMNELVNKIVDDKKDISQLTFLEPCVGVGNFVFSYLKAISALHLPKEKTRAVIENIYVADINQAALDIYKRIFSEFINIYFGIVLDEKYFDAHIGKGLLLDVSKSPISYIEIERVFPKSVLGKGFDIVVTNPPYKNLKAEKQQYLSDAVFTIDKQKYAAISKIVDKQFCYSTDGVLNLYIMADRFVCVWQTILTGCGRQIWRVRNQKNKSSASTVFGLSPFANNKVEFFQFRNSSRNRTLTNA